MLVYLSAAVLLYYRSTTAVLPRYGFYRVRTRFERAVDCHTPRTDNPARMSAFAHYLGATTEEEKRGHALPQGLRLVHDVAAAFEAPPVCKPTANPSKCSRNVFFRCFAFRRFILEGFEEY